MENVEVDGLRVDGLKSQVVIETAAAESVLSSDVRLQHSSKFHRFILPQLGHVRRQLLHDSNNKKW